MYTIPVLEAADALPDGRYLVTGGDGSEFVVGRARPYPHPIPGCDWVRPPQVRRRRQRPRGRRTPPPVRYPIRIRPDSRACMAVQPYRTPIERFQQEGRVFEDGSLRGWRCWSVGPLGCSERTWPGADVGLFSPVQHLPWPRGAFRATCQRCHPPASRGCSCGIYAFWEPDELVRQLGSLVFGLVAGWGRVTIHDRGWRAQWAMPRLLFAVDTEPATCRGLEDRYELSVVSVGHADIEQAIQEVDGEHRQS